MWGAIASSLGNIASGALNYFGQQDTNAQNQAIANQNNTVSLQEANQNIAMEKEFAQNGISWRVADAAKNGISPLAALGASEPSFSPVMPVMSSPSYQSPLSSLSAGVEGMGQNVSRALTVTRTPEQKANDALDLAYKTKQNDLLDVQIANAKLALSRASTTPGMPLGYTTVMNRDGTTSTVAPPGLNTHNSFLGPALWSLDNQLIPTMQDQMKSIQNAVDLDGHTYYLKPE